MRYKKTLGVVALSLVFLGAAGAYFWEKAEVSDYSLPEKPLRFQDIRMASATTVTDSEGKVLDYWYQDDLRLYRPIGKIDPWLRQLVVFLEDAKFFSHQGLDLAEIKKSFQENLEKNKIKRGASTITQQVAKNLFLDQKRSILRKLYEVPWALRIEKDLTKTQILELYLNLIEWGPGIYGAEAAARHYFDRSAEALDPGQAMYLALIIPSPVRFDLLGNPRSAKNLQHRKSSLIERLVNEKKVSAEKAEELKNVGFGLVNPSISGRTYPLSHEGNYVGNRWKKSDFLKLIEKNLRPKARPKSGRVKLTLSSKVMDIVSAFELVEQPGVSARTLILSEGAKVRAFRKLPADMGLAGLEDWLQNEGSYLSLGEVEKMSWAQLLE